MKSIVLLSLIVLGAISCKKNDVEPDKPIVITPILVSPQIDTTAQLLTNNVRITINSVEVGDSIVVYTSTRLSVINITSKISVQSYHSKILSISGFIPMSYASDGYAELLSGDVIHIEYKGDVTVDYL